jgi:beta-glucosidase
VVVEQSAQQPEAAPVIAPEPVQPATTTPVSRESGAYARQNLVLERANTSHAQVVLIGDSITEGWEGARDQLQSLVGLRSAANLGVGGDRTQHVLWRLQQAPLMSVNPKVIVLMIGTNNIYDDSADDIVAGIRAITALMNQQCPNAEILVLDIPPRGDPMDSARAKIAQINAELAQGEWPGHARFVRVGNQFLGADGALDRADLPDLLHFSQKGYAMWAAAIKPELDASLAANHSQPAPTTPQP